MSPALLVYFLCAIASTTVAIMLFNNFRKNRVRFLLWSSLGFFGLALNNLLLFLDMVIFTEATDLSVVRTIPAVVGIGILLYGFIWDVA